MFAFILQFLSDHEKPIVEMKHENTFSNLLHSSLTKLFWPNMFCLCVSRNQFKFALKNSEYNL